jgi:serine kinase of HPr protein (carbohydrate metabolism regulator)
MNIQALKELTNAKLLTPEADLSREVTSGYCCDLLSWVMSHGKSGMAWVTVQTHMNVVAVATLMEMAAIIVPEGIQVPEEVVKRASDEGLAILSSEKTAYELCGLMYGAGITKS